MIPDSITKTMSSARTHFRSLKQNGLTATQALVIVLACAISLDAAQPFRRGDADASGVLNIEDAIQTLGFLFRGTPDRLPCEDAADSNDDGEVNIADPLRTLWYLFLGTAAPPPPFGATSSDCGQDPTLDAIGCESFPPCPPLSPAPPVLDPLPSPTRASSIEVHGRAGAGLLVKIVGGADPLPVRALAGPDGAFASTVQLSSNRLNKLFAFAEDSDGRASAPTAAEVTQDSEPPFVYIDEPADGSRVLTDRVAVTGRVSDILSGFMGLGVTVNGLPAAIAIGIGTNGTFERQDVPLTLGENTIVAVATDVVGNTAMREIKITREGPPPDSDRLELASGSGQAKRPIHTTLPQPIVVRARKADGTALAGKLVTFRVTRSDGRLASTPAADPEHRGMTLGVLTDTNGLASAYWTLGSDAGCGNNRAKAAGAGLVGEVLFCASAAPGPASQINIGSGNDQRGEAGAPAREALRAWVSDGCNGIPGVPVTFRVVQGSGKVAGAETMTVVTGPTGHAQVSFVLGAEAGGQAVEADFEGNLGAPVVFLAHALLRDESRPTTFTGLVLDNAEQPIQGAVCILEVPGFEGVQTRTDRQGQFTLQAPAAGPGSLSVEGSFATHVGGDGGHDVPPGSFPALTYEVTLVPNAESSLPGPVLLPPLEPENGVVYDGDSETVLGIKGIEGLEMRLAPGTLVTLRDGTRVGPGFPGSVKLSLNQVHYNSVPMPMPDGAAPPFAWTLQPRGAKFDPPVRIKYPNMSTLPPGAIANFLSFNHDTGRFEIVSSGHVSSDGSTIDSDPGAGIKVAGWGGACPPYSVTGSCVHCSVKLTPKEQVVCTGQKARLTANAGPIGGTLTWISGGIPPSGTVSSEGGFGSTFLIFATEFATPGEKTVSAFWNCAGHMLTDSAKVKVVGINSIKATISHIKNLSPCSADHPDDVFTSASDDESMTSNPPLALPRKMKPLLLEAAFDPPGIFPPKLKWKVKRNADDAENGPTPPQPPPFSLVNLDTDAQGSFHIYCYCDLNDNDEPDANEPKKVLNLALVGVDVTSIVATPHPAELVQSNPSAGIITIQTGISPFDFARPERAATYVIANVLLTGGGPLREIGLDDITVFFIQNFRGDSFNCIYTGARTVREVIACNPADPAAKSPICAGAPDLMAFPVLDSDEDYPSGGITPSADCCHKEFTFVLDKRKRILEWLDSPGFKCYGAHPCGGGETLVSTSGGNDFVALLVSFSSQVKHSYVLHAKAEWGVNVLGAVAPDGMGNLIWTKLPGADITANASTAGLPQSGSDARIMVYGPTPIGAGALRCDGR